MIKLKKCKFTRAQINDAKKYGTDIELEHTSSRKKAYKIALQHECEFGPKALYYKYGLIPMEARLKKMQRRK